MAEKEYIERNELIKNLNIFAPEQHLTLVTNLIMKQPAADVVEVVRCKDCVHKNPYNRYEFHCKCLRDNMHHNTDDYCSYGERKE